jgi:hypothetical protein
MAQIVIVYDPKSRVDMRPGRLPKNIRYAALELVEMPEDPAELKALVEKVAALLLENIKT